MENKLERESIRKYWVFFALSAIVQIIFLIWIREYFWIVLPWVVTSFSKALRII